MTGKGEFMSIAFSKENLKFARDLEALTGEKALLCYPMQEMHLGLPLCLCHEDETS